MISIFRPDFNLRYLKAVKARHLSRAALEPEIPSRRLPQLIPQLEKARYMCEPGLTWALRSRAQRVAAHQLLHHGDDIHQAAVLSHIGFAARNYATTTCGANGFVKGMIRRSVREGRLSHSLGLLLFIAATTRSVGRAFVKAAASSVFYHLGPLVGYARARQPAWLPRWCRRCLWNRSEKIINGLTVHSLSALSVGIVGP